MSYTSPFTGLKSLFSLIDGTQEGQQHQQVSEEMKARLLQILRYRCRRYSRLGRWVYGSLGLKKQLEYFDKDGVPVTTLLFLAAVSLQEGIRNETFFGDWILHFYASNETNNMEEQYCVMPGRRLLTHSLAYSLTHWLTHSLTHWLTHSLTHSLAYSRTHSLLLTHSRTPLLSLQISSTSSSSRKSKIDG